MDIHFAATGTAGNAVQDLQKQFKAQRAADPDAWPATMAGLRDDVARAIQAKEKEIMDALPKEKRGDASVDVQVEVDLKLDIKITELTAKGVIEAFNAGEALPVLSESTPPKRRASSDASAAEPAPPK